MLRRCVQPIVFEDSDSIDPPIRWCSVPECVSPINVVWVFFIFYRIDMTQAISKLYIIMGNSNGFEAYVLFGILGKNNTNTSTISAR